MGYLICQNCGGYYKLKEGESAEDFVACECYGQLVYVEELDDSLGKEKISEDSDNELDFDSECIEITSEDLKDKEESESETVAKSDLYYSGKEPAIKNRAYYRRFDYYSEPDINQLKRLKDVSGLINALYYDDLKIKQEAAQALSAIGDERALEHLDKIIKAEGGTLKLYAEIAVNQIKSRKYGSKSRNRDNYRDITSESSKPVQKVYKPNIKSQGMIKEKEKIIPATDATIIDKDSQIPSLDIAKTETKLETDKEHPPSSVVSENKIISSKVKPEEAETLNVKLADTESSEVELEEDKPFDIQTSQFESVEVESDLKPVEVETSKVESVKSELLDVGTIDVKTSEAEVDEDKPSEIVITDVELPPDKVVDIESKDVELSADKVVDVVSTDVESPKDKVVDIEISVSEIAEPDIIKPEDVKSFKTKYSKTIKKRTPNKRAPIIMKTVDDTELSSLGFENQRVDKLKDSKSQKKIISKLFKPSPSSADKNMVSSKKPSPTTFKNKTVNGKGNGRESLAKDEDDLYFIRWLGIKNSDIPLIGLIVLSIMALIVGVILTQSSK